MWQAFPDGWRVRVESVAADRNDVLSWVEVPFDGQMSWCAQRARVFRGRITTAIDLWTDEGGVLVPSWRTALHDVDGIHAVPPSLPPDPASNEEPS
jgi:hypothetical protein